MQGAVSMPKNRRHHQRKRKRAIVDTNDAAQERDNLLETPGHFRRDARTIASMISCGAVSEEIAQNLLKKLYVAASKSDKTREISSAINTLTKTARLGQEERKLAILQEARTVVVEKNSSNEAQSDKVVDGEAKRLEYHNHQHLHVEHGSTSPVESESDDRAARVHEIAAGLGITINVSDMGETGT